MGVSGGFNDLPTLEFREQIVDAVDRNQVVILTAETGAGKYRNCLCSRGFARMSTGSCYF